MNNKDFTNNADQNSAPVNNNGTQLSAGCSTPFNNIKELLYNSVKLYPEHIAFVTKIKHPDKSIAYINTTYRDLLNDINALGTALYELGLQGKRVAIIGRNCYDWAVAHLSCLLGGIVSVPLAKELQLAELTQSLIRSRADAIIFDAKYQDMIAAVKTQQQTNLQIYIPMAEHNAPAEQCDQAPQPEATYGTLLQRGRHLLEQGKQAFIDHEVDSLAMSILLFTSGTTARAKAVMLNQKGIAANVADMLEVEDIRNTDTNIALLPFHHIFGSTCLVVMLAFGVKTVFADGLRYLKQNLAEYKVTVFVGVPVLIEKMYSAIETEVARQGKTKQVELLFKISNFLRKLHIDRRQKLFQPITSQLGGNLRSIIAGGAPLDKKTAQRFNEMGIHMVQGCGMTETSPVIAAEDKRHIKYGSVGLPMQHMQIVIDNPDPAGEGEIKVKGPNVMLGYYEDREATAAVLKDGWFYTGDLGYFDQEGYLFISGRAKDLIVLSNGKKVFPEELETLLNRLSEVEESFVYGAPVSNEKGKIMISAEVFCNASVVKEKYGDISSDELYQIIWNQIKELNKTLPQYKYIKHLLLADEPLIKTSSCKTRRQQELAKVLTRHQQ